MFTLYGTAEAVPFHKTHFPFCKTHIFPFVKLTFPSVKRTFLPLIFLRCQAHPPDRFLGSSARVAAGLGRARAARFDTSTRRRNNCRTGDWRRRARWWP